MNVAARPLLPLQLTEVPASLRRILEQEGVPFTEHSTAPTAGRFVLFDSRSAARPHAAPGQETLDVDAIRRSFTADPFLLLDDTSTARTWWQVGRWTAVEETARIDKGEVRRQVIERLRERVAARGGVWMRSAVAPFPYRTAFNFRFDHDAFVAADFAAVLGAVDKHRSATTHFVCAATHERYAGELRRLDGCDVGSHGYYHHTYATFAENRRNIARGIEALRKLGLDPRGFAAPHGRYHAPLAAATASLGIPYGSEFASAYDDRPARPAGSIVWQLPVHPVCLGIVLEAADRGATVPGADHAAAADAVAEYFPATAAAKRAVGEPIFLYGHPDGRLGRHPQVLQRLFEVVGGWSDVWRTTLTEFHRWWLARTALRFSVHAVGDYYEVRPEWLPPGFAYGIEWIDAAGEAAFKLGTAPQRVARETTTFAPRAAVHPPRAVRVESPRGWKERLRRALDWEYVTPLDEIDVGRWQGRLKRSLRRWQENRRTSRAA